MFKNNNVKLIIQRSHRATFNNPHDWSKGKVFIVLYRRMYEQQDNSGLNFKQLHWESGVNREYIKHKAGIWVKHGYLNRRAVNTPTGRPLYTYMLAARGRHFVVDIIPDDVRKAMLDEIALWIKVGRVIETKIWLQQHTRQAKTANE
jgi:hypothetical protein